MTTLFNEAGYTLQKDGTKLIVTDEGYGTVETFAYSEELVEGLIEEYEELKRSAE